MENSNITQFDKKKSKILGQKARKAAVISAILLIVLAICGIAYNRLGDIFTSGIDDTVSTAFSSISASGEFPYSFEDTTFEKFINVGEKPAVLTSDSFTVLSNSANVINNTKVTLESPKVFSNHGRAAVYSNTSNEVKLYSRCKKLCDYSPDGSVISVDLSKHGCLAVVSNGTDARNVLDTYDFRGEREFQWKCSSDYITSASLSDYGSKVAVGAIGCENVDIYSRILLFKTDGKSAEYDIKFPNATVLRVFMLKNGNVLCVFDNQLKILDSKGNEVMNKEYSDNSIEKISKDDLGNVLVCYSELGGTGCSAVVISPYGKVLSEYSIDFIPADVCLYHSKAAYSLGNTIRFFDRSGNNTKQIETGSNIKSFFYTVDSVYTEENGAVYKYKY